MSQLGRFGRFDLRLAERRLLVDGVDVTLGARAFDLLVALFERRDRLVTKGELLELVWPGLVVEENNLQVQVSALRKLLGAQAIATVPGRGYRFTLAVDPSADARPAAAPPDPDPPPLPDRPLSNLPLDADPLIGRDATVRAVGERLLGHRLVTVVGGGGIGKSRLARELGRHLLDRFADGVWWIDLAALSGGERIAPTIAQACGLPLGDGDGAVLLSRALAARRCLLVLDNCEHLVAPVVSVLQALLDLAPGVHVLVTSQVPLHLPAEQVWWLDALTVPADGATLEQARACSALAYFEQRAGASDQRFALDESVLPQAIALCRHLDGNALAIELAAARAPQLGVAALNQRLGERLRVLHSTGSARPARQQSLRATLDWSTSLLSATERATLRRLGVFCGSFGLESAQALVADTSFDEWVALDALGVLVDRSLVQVDSSSPPRYRLLETTRLYAKALRIEADEDRAWEIRHGQVMAGLAKQVHEQAYHLSRKLLIERYRADYDDLDAAFDAACARGDAVTGGATAQALRDLDRAVGINASTRRRMAAAHSLLGAAAEVHDRAWLWNCAAAIGSVAIPGLPRLEAARQRVAAWRHIGNPRELYCAWAMLASECARAGDFAAADTASAAAKAIEDPMWPPTLRMLGARIDAAIGTYRGKPAEVTAAFRKVLALAEQSGDPDRILAARSWLADDTIASGHLDEALALGRALLEDERRLRGAEDGRTLMNLCAACLLAGDDRQALSLAARALPPLRVHLHAGVLFNHLSLLAARAGDARLAARLLGHADRWYANNQIPHRQATELRVMDQALQAIDAAIGESQRDGLRQEGATLDDAKADELAWALLRRPPGPLSTAPRSQGLDA